MVWIANTMNLIYLFSGVRIVLHVNHMHGCTYCSGCQACQLLHWKHFSAGWSKQASWKLSTAKQWTDLHNNYEYYFCIMIISQVNLDLPIPLWVLLLHLFWEKTPQISRTGFSIGLIFFLSPNRQCQSTERDTQQPQHYADTFKVYWISKAFHCE